MLHSAIGRRAANERIGRKRYVGRPVLAAHCKQRRCGPGTGGDGDDGRIVSLLAGARPRECADVGARVVRKPSTDRQMILAARRAGIVSGKEVGLAKAATRSRRYGAAARTLSRTTD